MYVVGLSQRAWKRMAPWWTPVGTGGGRLARRSAAPALSGSAKKPRSKHYVGRVHRAATAEIAALARNTPRAGLAVPLL
jgi:hypothetical protein